MPLHLDRLRTSLWQAYRAARSHPGASLGAVSLLAAGIGLATAIFSLGDPYLWKGLPYSRPGELIVLTLRRDLARPIDWTSPSQDLPTLRELEQRTDLFAAVAAYRRTGALRVGTGMGSAFVQLAEVSPNFFRVLRGTADLQGREVGTSGVVLTAAAASRLGSNRTLQGSPAPGEARSPLVVEAVLPAGFVFPSDRWIAPVDAMVPWAENLPGGARGPIDQLTVIGRVKPGVALPAIGATLRAQLRNASGLVIDVRTIDAYMTRSVRPLALGALAAAVLLLAICCANVANLLLARTLSRREEMLTRSALGASRADLVRLELGEVGMLVGAGAALGWWFAHYCVRGTLVFLPEQYAALGAPSVSGRAAAFAGLAGAAAMLTALVPVGALARIAGGDATLAPAGPNSARWSRVVRFALTAGQSALAMVLVTGGALLARSSLNLATQDAGFSREPVVASVSYPDDYAGAPMEEEIGATVRGLRQLPGVQMVGAASGPMLDRYLFFGNAEVRGQAVSVMMKSISPDYVGAIGAEVVAGRALRASDRGGVLINQTLARSHWSATSPVGESIVENGTPRTIVGVVRDAFDVSFDRRPDPTIYSLLQGPEGCSPDCNRVSYVLRSSDRPDRLDLPIRRLLARLNPDAVVVEVSSLGDRLSGSVKHRSFATVVLGLFAASSLVVCGSGLLALVAFTVARRTREIAIRVALGARRPHIVALAVREVSSAVLVGLAVGVVADCWVSSYLKRLLYGVAPGDWTTVGWAALVIMTMAAAAALPPCLRALRLSPSDALHFE